MIPDFVSIQRTYESGPPQEENQHAEQATLPILKIATYHSAKDFLGHCLGRTAGLGLFTAVTHYGLSPITSGLWMGGAAAVAAGTQAFLISKHQIGTDSLIKKTAIGLCTVGAAAAGCTIAVLGSSQPVIALAVGAAATTAASLLKYCLFTQPDNSEAIEASKAVVFGMTTAASLALVSVIMPNWIAAESTLAYRSMGIVLESSVIELCKASLEKLGPSVNRNALTFNGKAKAALMGLVPYTVATVLFNGFVAGTLQPAHDSREFIELWGPLLVGSLSNAVKAAANAVAVLHAHKTTTDVADPLAEPVNPSQGLTRPAPKLIAQKIALRVTLSCCRNTLYFSLRARGLSVVQAACIAQACYSYYAQSRDLIFDLMQGEGWSEPVVTARSTSSEITV